MMYLAWRSPSSCVRCGCTMAGGGSSSRGGGWRVQVQALAARDAIGSDCEWS